MKSWSACHAADRAIFQLWQGPLLGFATQVSTGPEHALQTRPTPTLRLAPPLAPRTSTIDPGTAACSISTKLGALGFTTP